MTALAQSLAWSNEGNTYSSCEEMMRALHICGGVLEANTLTIHAIFWGILVGVSCLSRVCVYSVLAIHTSFIAVPPMPVRTPWLLQDRRTLLVSRYCLGKPSTPCLPGLGCVRTAYALDGQVYHQEPPKAPSGSACPCRGCSPNCMSHQHLSIFASPLNECTSRLDLRTQLDRILGSHDIELGRHTRQVLGYTIEVVLGRLTS